MRLAAWEMAIALVKQRLNFGAMCGDEDVVALPGTQEGCKQANMRRMVEHPACSHGLTLGHPVLNASVNCEKLMGRIVPR